MSGCIAAFVAAFAWLPAAPASTRTIVVPETLAGRVVAGGDRLVSFADFPATHVVVSWRGPDGSAFDYRITGTDGERARWTPAGEDDDEAGGGSHTTGVLSVGRARTLEWRPANALRVAEVEVDYVNTLDGPATRRVIPMARATTASGVEIVTRAEWGADESIKKTSGSCKRQFAPVQQLFVHHTAGSNSDSQNSAATMRAIYHYHVKSNGWCDIGYNFVIGRDGLIYEGRWARKYAAGEPHTGEDELGRAVIGAHVAGYNTGSVGVSLMGNFETGSLPAKMRDPLVDFLAWEADRHGFDPTERHTYTNGSTQKNLHYVAAHRDAGSTACPGTNVYSQMDQIRADAKERTTGDDRLAASVTLGLSADDVDFKTTVDVSGVLRDQTGGALPAREVALFRQGAGAWKLKERLTTGADGSFSTTVKPGGTIRLRAEFAGDTLTRAAASPVRTITVRHVVSVFAEGGRTGEDGMVRYPSSTKSVFLYGSVQPRHGSEVRLRLFRVFKDGSQKRLLKTPVALSNADFRHAVTLPGKWRYKVVVRYPGDDRHAVGRSNDLLLRRRS